VAQEIATQMPASAGHADGKLLLTVDEAADRLGIGRTLMYRLMSSGAVQSVTVGRLRRVPSESLSEYVAELRRGQAKSALAAILELADRGLPRAGLDAASLADLESAVALLRASLPGDSDGHRAGDSAA